MNLSTLIKSRRKNLGISQVEYAKHLGISQSALSKYERGKITKVPAELLLKVLNKKIGPKGGVK